GDAALLEGTVQLARGVSVLGWDQAVQHLDDRHLAAEVRQIEANSTPITPPPRMTMRPGTAGTSNRPVESTQSGPSIPSTGGRRGCDPVAMIACLKLTSSPPSTAIVFASLNRPRAETTSMPLALTTPVMPLTRPLTIVS